MTEFQKSVHARAVSAGARFREFELDFVSVLREVEETKTHRALGYPSLFVYAVEELKFTESVAYMFISVARKSREVPELLTSGLSVFKCSRLVSAIRPENSAELLEFAKTHTSRETDLEIARRNPKQRRERIKILSEDGVDLSLRVSKTFIAKLKRAESLLGQNGKAAGLGSTIEAALDELLRKIDPLQKAERAKERRTKTHPSSAEAPVEAVPPTELCANRAAKKRIPLTAEQKHAVFLRDGGRCTHILPSKMRCPNERWLHVHHIKEVSRGGGNDLENLTTLCSAHHELVHQYTLPLEGQISWLRSPHAEYTAGPRNKTRPRDTA